MHTILGAGGAIGSALVTELSNAGHTVRLVGRNPKMLPGVSQVISADLLDLNKTIAAVSGSSIVYLLVGLPYKTAVWREQWPLVMHNTIEACKRAQAKLIFFDNVYMYGKVNGAMTEETPFNPCSMKGEIRAKIATTLLQEIKSGHLQALIARSADFYGPNVRTSVFNMLVFDNFSKRKSAAWLVNDTVPHSFTFTPDAVRSLLLLANSDTAWNQTWHVPTADNPPTGKEYIQMVAKEFGVVPNYKVLGKAMIKIAGFFVSDIRESYEMLYQNDTAYVFDSKKFSKAFNVEPTSYANGIELAAAVYTR
jgi:nucleoside-diphosphate-sugar epimerase